MNKLIQRPQRFFIFLAIVILISGLVNKSAVLKIDMGGFFFDLNLWTTCIFSTLFYLLISVNYFSLTLTKKQPKRLLTLLHIVFQAISFIPFVYIVFTAKNLIDIDEIVRANLILLVSFFVFVIATFIHFINFFASLLSKKE